jgi:hypothetical protein
MSELNEVTSDFNYLYRNGQKFIPVIQEQTLDMKVFDAANTVLIKLSASKDDELIWEKERQDAQTVVDEGKLILWELDFGFDREKIDSNDSAFFYSLGIALDEFVQHFWSEYKEYSLGVILYRGDVDFVEKFVWNETQKEYFLEKLREEDQRKECVTLFDQSDASWCDVVKDRDSFKYFAADVFAEYFLRLVSYLPDSIVPFVLFDVSEQHNLAFLSQLLSKERFQHILLGIKKSPISLGHLNWEEGACLGGWIGHDSPYFSTLSEVSLGICLPSEDSFTSLIEKDLNAVFLELSERQIPFRLIPESLLTEAWDGIDHIIILSRSVTLQGKRRLQGFCAAGGKVVSIGDLLGLADEVTYDSFRQELSSQEALI